MEVISPNDLQIFIDPHLKKNLPTIEIGRAR